MNLRARLAAPADGTALAVLRIAFGLLISWEQYSSLRHHKALHQWSPNDFHFSYWTFDWVKPLPVELMDIQIAVCGIAALLVALGFLYRIATVILCVALTYQFLIERALYLNHFYLIILLALLFIAVPAQRSWSLDQLRRRAVTEAVPTWSIWLMRFQIGLVYCFAGVAKLNSDWLGGAPMRMWTYARYDVPFIQMIVDAGLERWLFSMGGLAVDLIAVPALLWRPSRPAAFALTTTFHLLNSQIFNIGLFPWLMIAATTLFFAPDWPRRTLAVVLQTRYESTAHAPGARSHISSTLLTVLAAYALVQMLVPLRHFLYPGNVAWTEEGHMFSWRMLLREKIGSIQFLVDTPDTTLVVDPRRHIPGWKVNEMVARPELIRQFAHFVKESSAGAEREHLRVRAVALVSLNGGPMAAIVDSTMDLSNERSSILPARFITRHSGRPRNPRATDALAADSVARR